MTTAVTTTRGPARLAFATASVAVGALLAAWSGTGPLLPLLVAAVLAGQAQQALP
ncbi:hypothetical protein AB0J74_01660 [Asanoa sp. NPDC049573]|uniref:hypothetical protein n=1 Tax=Asanoa sp. NPDC049573 TaxID=3155396 RepID=UPI003447CE55